MELKCPLGIGTARDGIFRGRSDQEGLNWLKKGLLEKLDCQQVLKGWKVWGVGREEEEEGRALLEGAQQDQSQEGQPSYSFIIHPTHVLQSLWGVPG